MFLYPSRTLDTIVPQTINAVTRIKRVDFSCSQSLKPCLKRAASILFPGTNAHTTVSISQFRLLCAQLLHSIMKGFVLLLSCPFAAFALPSRDGPHGSSLTPEHFNITLQVSHDPRTYESDGWHIIASHFREPWLEWQRADSDWKLCILNHAHDVRPSYHLHPSASTN